MKNAVVSVLEGFLPSTLFITGTILFFSFIGFLFSLKFWRAALKSIRKGASFSSLCLALGGTLGVGNICGVASAVYIGGAGTVFWIWVCAVLSAVTKYCETVLAVAFSKNGGSAHSYVKKAFGSKKPYAVFSFFCIVTAFTMGNVTQVRSAATFAFISKGIPYTVSAAVFFIFVTCFTLGKGKAVKRFTSFAVPVLCCLYVFLCTVVIIAHRNGIVSLTNRIISEAFTPSAETGGFLAFLSCPQLRFGITRGVTSNEAGCGTAPIAYASDKNAVPFESGILGITEVLIDTLLLCTLTAYAVLLPQNALCSDSALSVLNAFTSVFGYWIAPVITVSVFLFALASVGAWSYYAEITASELGANKNFHRAFAILYPAASVIGCFTNENASWFASDLCVSIMGIINGLAVIMLIPSVKRITREALENRSR